MLKKQKADEMPTPTQFFGDDDFVSAEEIQVVRQVRAARPTPGGETSCGPAGDNMFEKPGQGTEGLLGNQGQGITMLEDT